MFKSIVDSAVKLYLLSNPYQIRWTGTSTCRAYISQSVKWIEASKLPSESLEGVLSFCQNFYLQNIYRLIHKLILILKYESVLQIQTLILF